MHPPVLNQELDHQYLAQVVLLERQVELVRAFRLDLMGPPILLEALLGCS
jgi:hypothetical protein